MSQIKKSVVVRIAGAAGDGIASSGEIFGKACSRQGLHVMAYNAYQSAIRGGHVWLQLNVGSEKTLSHGEKVDLLVLLNPTGVPVHLPDMKEGGAVLYDSSKITQDLTKVRSDLTYYGINFREVITDSNVKSVMINVLLMGAVIELLGMDPKTAIEFIEHRYGKKGPEVIELNKKVFQAGMDWVKKNGKQYPVHLKGDGKRRMFLSGNEAFGMGLIAAGLKFYAAYPMSPSTGILHYIAKQAKKDKIVVKQTEDEIAAANFIIGASHAGVRAATATSGGGFALMIEAIGLACMLEDPIVVINVQRGGPSTGIPTKQEQADLNMVIGGPQGDAPRIVLAPKDTTDAFSIMARAFNLAEKYQTPVLVLSDLFLSEHFQTVEEFKFNQPIERGKLIEQAGADYKRFQITDDGVSPRLIPGAPQAMYVSASDEHDEKGIVISDVLAGLPASLDIRNRIHEKRMRKLEGARADMKPPTVTGPKDASITLLGWGSTYDVIEEACELLRKDGLSVNHVHFTELFPLPVKAVLDILNNCEEIVAVENNYSCQMSRLILAETGFQIKRFVRRYDGEPFTGEDIVDRFKKTELSHV